MFNLQRRAEVRAYKSRIRSHAALEAESMERQYVVLIACSWTILLLVEAAAVTRRNINTDHANDILQNRTIPSSFCTYHETNKSSKPPYTSGTLLRIHDATYGRLFFNQSLVPPTKTVWRIICAHDPVTGERGTASVVLMNLTTTIGDYVQIKQRRIQGCSHRYRGFVFNKKSILTGYIPGPYSEGGKLELGYVCIRPTMQRLASKLLLSWRPLEYIQNKGMFERVATLLLEGEDGLLEITDNDPDIRELLNLAQPTPHREQSNLGSGDDFYNN